MQSFLRFPLDYPNCFCLIGTLFTLYYGVRAVVNQHHKVGDENIQRKKQGLVEWTKLEKLVVHYIQDAIFNMTCCLAGFAALYVEVKIFDGIPNFTEINTGTAIVLGFLSLVAVLGISGALPFTLLMGKIFGTK